MSSDILSRPFDAGKFALIYAGAQKNLGPSGVTAVLLRESWLAKANKNVPTMLRYATHVKNNSLYNTPPTFGVYVLESGAAMDREDRRPGGHGRAQRRQGRSSFTKRSTGAAASTAATPRRSRVRR